MRIKLLLFLIATHLKRSQGEDPWSFIVIADPHIAETFASRPETHEWFQDAFATHLESVTKMKQNYGGDLVLIPGDTNSGKWYLPSFAKDKLHDASLTPAEAVAIASRGCYGTLKKLFSQGGYDNIMVAIGDHELGGNGWHAGGLKMSVLDDYRYGFQLFLNRDETGAFLHSKSIGRIPSRPLNTPYENTSYAQQYKNVLFVTVDCFHDKGFTFQDNVQGLGGEGDVTVTVEGLHLKWFESILKEARQDSSIKHIVVQAHVPILQPVRLVLSTGQFFDHGGDSEFWKAMEEYNVDIYLAGEVHATTVSKQKDSNVLQVASRGNQFNNFLNIQVTDDSITIRALNEVGVNSNYYEQYGELVVDKTGNTTQISAEGILEPVSVDSALIRFDFESLFSLNTFEVIGMRDKDEAIVSIIDMRGMNCSQAMQNKGGLGQLYNAQVANIELVRGRRGRLAAKFLGSQSRFGLYASGPLGGGSIPISYNIWVKTDAQETEMVIAHYGQIWGIMSDHENPKNFHTLTLENGNPKLYISVDAYLVPSTALNLNDGKWHHLSVSMSKKSCLLSEVEMYIDGKQVKTSTPHNDNHIFHVTGGRMSLGGFGYSANYEAMFPNMIPYEGLLDEFILFARPVAKDLKWMMAPAYDVEYSKGCAGTAAAGYVNMHAGAKKCKQRCNKNKTWCAGYQFSKSTGQKQCTLFEVAVFGEATSKTRCGIML